VKIRWQTKTLGEVCKTGAGGTPLKAKKVYYEGGTIPWLMSGEVSQGEIREANNFITQKGLENSSARLFPKNTVLVAMYGATSGQVGILKFEAATNQAVCGILPNKQFIPAFLFYLMLSKKDELVAQASGNAQPNISQIKIRNTLVPLAPLTEQQRIVKILDEAFAGIATAKANSEKNLQNARSLFESHLNSVFTQRGKGWVERPLVEVCQIKPTKAEARRRLSDMELVSFVPMENLGIDLKFFLPTQAKTLSEVSGSYTYFADGDVLLAKITPCFENGKLGIAANLTNGIGFGSSEYIVFRSGPSVNKEWLYYYLSRDAFRKEGAERMSGAVGHKRVSKDFIEGYPIPIPPLPEQQHLIEQLDLLSTETKRLESIYQRKLDALDELKESLLHDAFRGAL